MQKTSSPNIIELSFDKEWEELSNQLINKYESITDLFIENFVNSKLNYSFVSDEKIFRIYLFSEIKIPSNSTLNLNILYKDPKQEYNIVNPFLTIPLD